MTPTTDETAWEPVALGAALDRAQVLAAPAAGGEHVLWRDEWGRLHAHQDRCPHRGMRLSYGFVRDGRLACPYHGWQFDGTGQCRALPAHPSVTPAESMRLRSLPVAERDGLVWLQPGMAADSPDPPEPPAATWPPTLAVAPVRSVYLRLPATSLDQAMHRLQPTDCPISGTREGHSARTSGQIGWWLAHPSDSAARGMGWALQRVGDGRTGVHVLALWAAGSVPSDWRRALSRALRALDDLAVIGAS